MRKLPASLLTFASGAAVAVIIVALLTVSGILPVRTVETKVVKQTSTSSAATTETAALTTGALTAEQIYKQDSAGVVEVLSTFDQRRTSPVRPASSTSQALGSGFVVSSPGLHPHQRARRLRTTA